MTPPAYKFEKTGSDSLLANSTEKRKELEAKIIQALEEKIHVKYRGKIEEMAAAAEEINQKFEIAQKNALILGVDLKDSNLDYLVKGRLFEVYGAKYWHNHSQINIVDWTPDKGFQHSIDVKSNGNPDFLLEVNNNGEKFQIAIECKYRNSRFPWNPDKKVHEISVPLKSVIRLSAIIIMVLKIIILSISYLVWVILQNSLKTYI